MRLSLIFLLTPACHAFVGNFGYNNKQCQFSIRKEQDCRKRHPALHLSEKTGYFPPDNDESFKGTQKKAKSALYPQAGDIVRYYDLDGGKADGQVLVGRISFIQKDLSNEDSGWKVDLTELDDVGDGYYAEYSWQKMNSKKSVRDLAAVSPISASFVGSEQAFKVPRDKDTGGPMVRAERYDIEGYEGPFTGENSVDQGVVEADAVIYGALKGGLYRWVAVAGLTGTVVINVVKGTEDAVIYAAGAAASLAYLFLLSLYTDTVGSPNAKLGKNISSFRFAMPFLVMTGIALYNLLQGDASPVSGGGVFQFVTAEQFAVATLGFLTYRVPLFLTQIIGALKDSDEEVAVPGSVGIAMKLAKKDTDDDKPLASLGADLATIFVVSGPQATGRSALVQTLIEEGNGRFTEPERVDRLEDPVAFEQLEQRDEFMTVDSTGRYGTTKQGILSAAKAAEPGSSVVVVDADVELAKKLQKMSGARLVGAWVGLNSVQEFEDRLKVQIDNGEIPIPEDETEQSVLRARIREIVQEIEFGISSGIFEFTILNENQAESIKQLREAANYCFT